MKIAVTGATGFIGSYIVRQLLEGDNQLRCWYRDENRIESELQSIRDCEWVPGELNDKKASDLLVAGCEAVVHGALWKPGATFRGGEGNIVEFCQRNILGSLQLIEAAREAGVQRFVFISTCAVHENILDDRKLDEAHPVWPLSHYGAHKAAIEKFIHSYGFGKGYSICALRPSGVYGIKRPVVHSKWYQLIEQIVNNQPVKVDGGGKEVHAADVAKAVAVLLSAENIAGEVFNCYDRYIPKYDVATIAKRLSKSSSEIIGAGKSPLHEIETGKLRSLGMEFGGDKLLENTIASMIEQIKQSS